MRPGGGQSCRRPSPSAGPPSCSCRAWNGVGRRCAGSPRRRLSPWACLCRSAALIAFRVVGRSSCSITPATWTRSFSAVLPHAPTYLAKKELAAQFFAGHVLRRLGALFLERYDLSGSLADTAMATDAAREGRLLVIFPEGTFTRRPGLLDFHLAPFKIACEANLPVFPGVIRGTRSMLRSDQWFPRWGPITVAVAEPSIHRHRLRLGAGTSPAGAGRHPGRLR